MNKDIAQALCFKIQEVEKNFSNPDRAGNGNKETFSLEKIVPLSELTAAVFFNKSTGKKAIAFFYWVKQGNGYWQYFFPCESHVFGMSKVVGLLQEIEEFNFPKNFPTLDELV